MTTLLWFRRDLRLGDHPALEAAAADGPVLPVFVVDPGLWADSGAPRRAWIARTVLALRESMDGALVVRSGDATHLIPELAREHGADAVHVTRETTPWGRRRDEQVAAALSEFDIDWVETGTPYAVGPGVISTGSDTPYKVFTPFAKAWREHGWPAPASGISADSVAAGEGPEWVAADSDDDARRMLADASEDTGDADLPEAGEQAALDRWRDFLDEDLADYADDRDRADRPGTTRMSPYLKAGSVHPRTLLADLATRRSDSASKLVAELAWREFYADVLFHNPRSLWRDLRPALAGMDYDDPDDELVSAWQEGRTGYPIVDAGMRQLVATGWMHNRVRMITASFLTKDLHLWWPIGARFFLDHLIDGDPASNNHGWQWVAGTGTDASPYFRVFNPVTQGKKFDPQGDYVRRWIPELSHLTGAAVHEPWKHDAGYEHGYPEPIVDHAEERREALERYDRARG